MGEELFGIGGTIAGGIYGGNAGALIGGAAGSALGNRIFGEDEDDALRRARTSANTSARTDRFALTTTGGGTTLEARDTPASLAREERVAKARADLLAAAEGERLPFLNNQFVDAQIAEIEDQRLERSSNLRATFDRRRIPAGTSFREALISQSDKEFAKSKAAIRGSAREAALQNLFRSIDTVFAEANLEADRELDALGIATGQSQAASSLAQANAQFERDMARLQAVGTGQFLGLLGTQFGDKSESDSDTRPQAGNFSIFDGFGSSGGGRLGVGSSRAISGSSSKGAGSSPFFSDLIGAGS